MNTINQFRVKIDKKVRTNFYPLWLIGLGDLSLSFLDRVNKYSLIDQANSISCEPLFIISAGRSGTTLLRSMLVIGKEISIPPESYIIPTSIRTYHMGQIRKSWSDICRYIVSLFENHPSISLWNVDFSPVYQILASLPDGERSLARIIDEVFMHYAGQHFPGVKLWGDQTPLNTLYLPWIRRTFPNAKYLHLVRDGRDTIASYIDKGETVERASRRWILSVQQARKLAQQLDRKQFLEVKYESLVRNPDKTLSIICNFVGINYQSTMLDFWREPTTIEHRYLAHHKNLAKPLFTDSIGRWRERLTRNEQSYVIAKTSSLLQEFGYL